MRLPALVVACLGLLLGVAAAPVGAGTPLAVEVLGAARIPGDLEVDGTLVGGLSGLAYDPGCDLYYALSDDRGSIGPYRLYALRVSASAAPVVEVIEALVLEGEGGRPIPRGDLDLEAVALDSEGTLYLASEGAILRGVAPSVSRFGLDGRRRGTVPVPPHYLSDGAGHGVRDNLGFEGMALSPGGGRLFLAVENALLQDGPIADLGVASPSRILVMDRRSGATLAEYAYLIEPVPDTPHPATSARTNGISELLAVDEHRLIVVERAFAAGVGNRVRLYLVDLRNGDDVQHLESLAGTPARPLAKTLVADLSELGVVPDNIEAAAFGPALTDGRRVLILISDNNFQPRVQQTQVVVLAVSGVATPQVLVPAVRIADIQGAGHWSPWVGRCVRGVEGVVTAVLGRRSGQAFWLQDPVGDGIAATSEGLFVTSPVGEPALAPGDLVRLEGRVEEPRWGRELPVTRMFATAVGVLEKGRDLPLPVILGTEGREIPQPEVAAADLAVFDPDRYAADAFESLEGMAVAVRDAVVVGPTDRFGEVAVLADDGRSAVLRTDRGGVRLLPGNVNPQRVLIDDAIIGDEPRLTVGDRLARPVEGVLHYSFGSYKVLNTAPLPEMLPGGLLPERTELAAHGLQLTVATYNVENLSAVSDDERFRELAHVVVEGLASPDILAVQEVQDDSGPADDGTVSAAATLQRIVAAVESAGGPRYEWRSVEPVNNTSGGQPGANIRNAFLFDPERVRFIDRGSCGAAVDTAVGADGVLVCSPGLLGTAHPAFSPGRDDEGGSRKPLVGAFRFAGRDLYLVNLHLASKGGDDPMFGRRQPPVAATAALRLRQAEAVSDFVRELAAADPEAWIIVLGDLNDFEGSQPLAALEAAGLEDLVRRLPPEARYTYVHLGNSQVLDHVLASRDAAAAAEIDAVHLNSEFPAAERASDHDPVLVRLSFER